MCNLELLLIARDHVVILGLFKVTYGAEICQHSEAYRIYTVGYKRQRIILKLIFVLKKLVSETTLIELFKPLFYTRMRLGEFDPPEMNPYTR